MHLNLPGLPDGAAFDADAVMDAIVPGRKAAWHLAVRVTEELDAKGLEIAATRELSETGKQKLLSRAVRDAGVTLNKIRTHVDKLRSS